ncbi:DEAD-domain-containing protein [Russula ochroleuca]|uniref:DEAD-domain-containing protein n=1 Tax=Russula ochroleuca TaxID=152965 RepID=A0A9P5N4R8_9AGAM|nr:DEAD-domain-containing protein [Russula ochroleuca]
MRTKPDPQRIAFQVALAWRQEDKSLPLYADLLKGIYDMSFTKRLNIQESALSMIGPSQSGTRKTANKPQALCLAPSREHARQISDQGSLTEMRVEHHCAYRGTPGTMTDLIRRRVIDVEDVKVFVLDEADNMLDKDGPGDQTLRVKTTQIILFSATFPDHVRNFASKFAPSANKIELQRNELALDSTRQFYMDCKSEDHKYEVLVSLYYLLTIGQSIIFRRQRRTADRIVKRMVAEGHKVASLHDAEEGSERDSIIDGVREGRTGRSGRKGISINFVHDMNTWAQMEEIEKATGKGITRIKTADLDVTEEQMKKAMK